MLTRSLHKCDVFASKQTKLAKSYMYYLPYLITAFSHIGLGKVSTIDTEAQ